MLLLESSRFRAAEALLRRAIAICGEGPALLLAMGSREKSMCRGAGALNEVRSIEENLSSVPLHIPWLELALGLTGTLLVLQLFPSLGAAVWGIVDFRNWSNWSLTAGLIVVLVGLLTVRAGRRVRSQLRPRKGGRNAPNMKPRRRHRWHRLEEILSSPTDW